MQKEVNMSTRTAVAFLGLGAMGSRMASRLVSDEIDLRVWSRSGPPAGAASLCKLAAPTAADAVKGAGVVIAMVTDDDASRRVWLDAGVLRSMRTGAIAVECSTLSPGWVSELATHARDAGLRFVDAPVVGSRPQAEAGAWRSSREATHPSSTGCAPCSNVWAPRFSSWVRPQPARTRS
jgi:3-hydroxyisobutyrate dehydrogenase